MACFCSYCFSAHRFVGIGSAAKRVFAIPEPLERILLSIDDDNYVCKMSAAKRLFILQRVDTTFANIIHGSCMLKYRMGLDYKPRGPLASTPKHDILSTFLDFLTPTPRISCRIDEHGVLNVKLGLAIDRSTIPTIHSLRRSLSRTTLRPHYWRRAKITSIKIPTRIHILVQLTKPDNYTTGVHYREYQYHAASEGTMGDVATLLMKIERRSFAKH
jgi:hypothetical protein